MRLADGAANPYLLQAAIIVAGLDGLSSKADPGKRRDNNMYTEPHLAKGAKQLPLNLLDALRAFERNKTFRDGMGKEFSAAYRILRSGKSLIHWMCNPTPIPQFFC